MCTFRFLFDLFLFLDVGKVDVVGLLSDTQFLYPLLLSSIFIASEKSTYMTGEIIKIDGGMAI